MHTHRLWLNQSTGEPFGRGFECYSDTNIGGAMEYAYSYTNVAHSVGKSIRMYLNNSLFY